MAHNPGSNYKFLVLDYGDSGELEHYLHTEHLPDILSGRLIVYKNYTDQPFQMSHAKNMAHRLAILNGADILCNMDADNYSIPGFADYIMEKIGPDPENTFLYCNAKSVVGRARQGLAGRIVTTSNTFLKVGGYDERYTVWAPEDEDFKSRVKRLDHNGILIENEYLYVLPHKDGLRFKEYPDAKPTPESEILALRKIRESTNIIANHGNLGCGVVYKNYGPIPTVLTSIPTRIFGIGMQKTATTSLYTAFNILGFDSAHWTGPWWSKRIWQEVVDCGRSLTLERHYAMCDLPFTFLFKELDTIYPGSKFILTTRDEKAWLESVRNHFIINKQRFDWDNDCFTHKCHWLMYGRRTFDADIMLNRYRAHNTEVVEYFKHRPEDLLVMDMNHGTNWDNLCKFLNQPIPSIPYPKAFVTPKS